ncbi:MAG: uncharacterized protein JWN04_17, partial [Myxococcaceae bacterium]|nr:uncharacterized protein [Myxococcaceae bacterium]
GAPMTAVVPNLLLAGVLLALLEIAWVLVRAHVLFLSLGERLLYALGSASGIASCVLLLGAALWFAVQASRTGKLVRWLWTLAWTALGAGMLWSLSDGRRVRDLTVRPYVVAGLSLAIGAAAWLVPKLVQQLHESSDARARWLLLAGCFVTALVVLLVDGLILPRGYPAFHLGLALLASLLASVAGVCAPLRLAPKQQRRVTLAAAVMMLLAPFVLNRIATHPTAGFAVRERAPWSARLVRAFTPRRELHRQLATGSEQLASEPVMAPTGGVDLRDRDILLITVDALRADLLRVYGGTGTTPELDRLARESAVFMHAYTPAPHTSYALASLLTGKFVKPLVELGGKLGDPPTLPDRLRRYGYRTAAFYPPAIFFVDGASFEPLQKRGFGFEYRKEMFASAAERVRQLSEYLSEADPKRPLFAWVHLFEPHEPYDPPPAVGHDGSERGRYEAEVAVCDGAIAQLVERFRAARPNATVIVTADHGEEFGDHGGSFHGTSLYDEQVRIPLLWSSPGVVAPQQIEAPVELTDLGTTILSTASIPRDAHMRGDDLGAVLANNAAAGPRFAFASIEARQMVTDGRLKLVCGASDTACALFDLKEDPREVRNLAGARAADVVRLRVALDAFLSSIARTEAVTVSAGVRLPEVLARAKLSGSAHVEELLALLTDPQTAVRLEAARVLGQLGVPSATPNLERVRSRDEDPHVRAEAAISQLQLGDPAALVDVLALVAAGGSELSLQPRTRRAGLALARFQRSEALGVLAAWVRDESATESERLSAVRALGQLGSPLGVEPLVSALASVRLRVAAALALGQLGGAGALAALRRQLADERYPPARVAEARALQQLGDPSVSERLRHFLGMESSLPDGVCTLAELGALDPSGRSGALLSDPSVREGQWACHERGCSPEAGARVVLPRRGPVLTGPVRVTIWFRDATPGSALLIDGERKALQTEGDQLSFVRSSASKAARFSFAREGDVLVTGLVVVPSVPEIPPPPPEPWGVDAGAAVSNEPVR